MIVKEDISQRDELSVFNESYERLITAASGLTGKTVEVTDQTHPNYGIRGTIACIECTDTQAYFQIHPCTDLRSGPSGIHLKKVPAICVSAIQEKTNPQISENSDSKVDSSARPH